MQHYGITQSQHWNVLRTSVWLDFFGGLFLCQNSVTYGREMRQQGGIFKLCTCVS